MYQRRTEYDNPANMANASKKAKTKKIFIKIANIFIISQVINFLDRILSKLDNVP